MNSTWNFNSESTRTPRAKGSADHAEQERNRLTRVTEMVQTFTTQATAELRSLTASEVLSALVR